MRYLPLLILCAALIASCQPASPPAAEDDHEPPAMTNRIDIPARVRSNLGITFARVERRHVAQTMRVPGRFEATPEAILSVRAPLAGRIDLKARQYTRLEAGAALFVLDSPHWRQLHGELEQATAIMVAAGVRVGVKRSEKDAHAHELDALLARVAAFAPSEEAAERHEAALLDARRLWRERTSQVEMLHGRGAATAVESLEARAQLAQAEVDLAEQRSQAAELIRSRKQAESETVPARARLATAELEIAQAQAEEASAVAAFEAALGRAAALTGMDKGHLIREVGGKPRWKSMTTLEVVAPFACVVSELKLTTGAMAAEGETVLTLLDPSRLRVRARGLQADLLRLSDGLKARVLAPAGGDLALAPFMDGVLTLGLEADADERVLDLLVTPTTAANWARPGVAVEVEITLASTMEPKLAVPLGCVVRDELDHIVFRRDPHNADKVIRITPEFGLDDGRWIVIETEVMEGDEIVLHGVYELKLTGSGKPTGAGHFHADGTWHAGSH